MSSTLLPRAGTRFKLYGAEFEIAHVASSIVRYASVAGGRIFKIDFEEFQSLLAENVLEIEIESKRSLAAEDLPRTMRMYRYVEAALARLAKPHSVQGLEEIIGQVSDEIKDTSPPCVSSVSKWIRRHSEHGISGLALRYSQSGNRSFRLGLVVEQYIDEAIRSLYLKREKHSAADLRSYVAARLMESGMLRASNAKQAVPSLRTIQRRLQQLDPIVVIRAQKGAEAAKRAARAAGQSIQSIAALSLVQIDSHRLDVEVIDPDTKEILGRPYLVCILDVHTRCVVGWHLSLYPPSSVTALAALKDLLTRHSRGLPGGVPSRLVSDLGVEFINDGFSRTCMTLSIILIYSQVRDPNGKGNIERFFGTLAASLVHKLEGTTFSSPTMRGDYASGKRAVFTLDNVRSFIDEWIEDVYHRTVHTGTGRAPIIAWHEQIAACAPMSLSQEDADAVARRPVTRTIQHGRVRSDGIEYFSHTLSTLRAGGEKAVTVLIDDLDLNSVLVQHPSEKGVLIRAMSTKPDYTTGLTRYMHEEAQKIKKRLAEDDRMRLGGDADLLARWKLFERIHRGCKLAKKMIAKLTRGKGKNVEAAKEMERTGMQLSAGVVFVPKARAAQPAPQLDASLTNYQNLGDVGLFESFDLED